MNLKVDDERLVHFGESGTGIYVRARDSSGKMGSFDLAVLDEQSVYAFLRSRGGKNVWAENCVAIMLGYSGQAEAEIEAFLAQAKDADASHQAGSAERADEVQG